MMINPNINISQATIAKHSGWLALWPEKKRGVFCYYDEGVFKRKDGTEIPFEKIRLADVHITKNKQGREYIRYAGRGQQKYSLVGFYKELAPYVRQIIQKVYEEVVDKPADESEIDKILKETGGVF